MTDTVDVDLNQSDPDSRKARMIAAGGILGALAASNLLHRSVDLVQPWCIRCMDRQSGCA
ncbi:hypothetical protein [Lentibacter algarum]|uniref:hypothetical protein n=1 Tax=Lentibacter algarum TaxID=576131 RepID=UPI003AF69749